MITAILIEIFSNLNFWFEQSSAAAEANQIQAYSRAALHYLGDVKKIVAAHYLPKYIVVGIGILYIFLNCGVFQCGLCDKSQEGIKIFWAIFIL